VERDPAPLIHGCEVQCLIADRQEFCPELEEFRILHAHRVRSGMSFYGDDFGEHWTKKPTAKVLHEAI
jgi:hypothetical protein